MHGAISCLSNTGNLAIPMAHEKVKSVLLFTTIFLIVGAVSWAVVSAQQASDPTDQIIPQFDLQGHIRDTVMAHIASTHSEVSPLFSDTGWTGGRVETTLLGAETYTYQSEGWNVTINYPVVQDPVYSVTVHYSVPEGTMGIPYSVDWEGTWQDSNITETNFVFAQ
jgi:hypothetical protein